MRAVPGMFADTLPGIASKLREVCQASQQVTEEVADAFTLSNFTVTRTLDVSTATLTDLKNVVATFIHDMQQRGSTRTNG